MEHELIVNEDGSLQAIFSDDLVGLFALGHARTRRASNVEPYRDGWSADMSPVGGPVLLAPGRVPFRTRAAALRAEVRWLKARMARRRLDHQEEP